MRRSRCEAADELAAQLTPELLRIESPPMADWLEAFVPLRTHVLIRFGRWDDLDRAPLPADTDLYCTTTAIVHYGRGVAYAATGGVAAEAARERERSPRPYARIPESRYLFNNTCRDILAVAAAMLDGEIAYREGRVRRGVHRAAARDRARRRAALRRAVGLDAADPARLRRAAARAGPCRGGRRGVCRRPRARPHAEPALPAPGQRVEPARLPRVPPAAGAATPRRGSSASRLALAQALALLSASIASAGSSLRAKVSRATAR